MNQEKRILGGLYGSLVGDALGVPVEFASREKRKLDPVTDMRAHGMHNQPAGTWSDDGSLLLCSVESLAEKGFDFQDMGERFLKWFDTGHWAAHGLVFDIGNATRNALDRISMGTPAEVAGGHDQYDNGNGSLMRILPVPLASLDVGFVEFKDRLQRASSVTHGHERSQAACVFHGLMVRELMAGKTPAGALNSTRGLFRSLYEHSREFSTFRDLLRADLALWPETEIRSGGYVMETLTASLWCLLTTDNFSNCVLKAVNLGDDTDTTGCVAGGLAGVFYGVDAIPAEWRLAMPRQEDLRRLFAAFLETSKTTL